MRPRRRCKLHAFDKSAVELGVDRLDLLLHQAPPPLRSHAGGVPALETLLADGRVRVACEIPARAPSGGQSLSALRRPGDAGQCGN